MKVYKFKSIYHSPPDPIGYYRVHDNLDNVAYFKDGVLLKTLKFIKADFYNWSEQIKPYDEVMLEFKDGQIQFVKNKQLHNEFEAANQDLNARYKYWLNGKYYDEYENFTDETWAKFCKLKVFS